MKHFQDLLYVTRDGLRWLLVKLDVTADNIPSVTQITGKIILMNE